MTTHGGRNAAIMGAGAGAFLGSETFRGRFLGPKKALGAIVGGIAGLAMLNRSEVNQLKERAVPGFAEAKGEEWYNIEKAQYEKQSPKTQVKQNQINKLYKHKGMGGLVGSGLKKDLKKEAKKKGESTYDQHEYPGAGRIGKYTGVAYGAPTGAGLGIAAGVRQEAWGPNSFSKKDTSAYGKFKSTMQGGQEYLPDSKYRKFMKKIPLGVKTLAGGAAGLLAGGWAGGQIGERIFGGPRLDNENEKEAYWKGQTEPKPDSVKKVEKKTGGEVYRQKTWKDKKGRTVRSTIMPNPNEKPKKSLNKEGWFKGAKPTASKTHQYHPGTPTGKKIRGEFDNLKIKINQNMPIITDTTSVSKGGYSGQRITHRSVNPSGKTHIINKTITKGKGDSFSETKGGSAPSGKTIHHIANRKNSGNLVKHDIK